MHHRNLLEVHRASLALTQSDVGTLLGLTDDTIGGYERAERLPSLHSAFALEIVLGRSLPQLFPDTYRAVAEALVRPAQSFSIRIKGEEGPAADKRLKFILDLGDRLARIAPGV